MTIHILQKQLTFLHSHVYLTKEEKLDLTWLTNCTKIRSCCITVPEELHSSIVVLSEALCQADFCKNHTNLHQKIAVLLFLPGLSFNNDSLLMLFLFGGFSSFAVGWVASVSEAHATTIFRFKVRRWRCYNRITKGEM